MRPCNRPHEAWKHPLVLLRALPALIGLAWHFWPLMIMVISTGRRARLGRQAWRALGWNVREVKLEILPRSRTGPTPPDASRSIAPR